MQTIHELPKNLQSKIAAGEVIERPAYIVKELIENALDAHSSMIRVEIEEGGTTKVAVTDNGHGMSKEDVMISHQRHTTSKMLREDDLTRIKTMGFRGEALASIAAIATLTVRSRQQDESIGYELRVENGQERFLKKGMPKGTQVIVQNIFSLIPARQKFLKKAEVEYRLVSELMMRYALAFPEVEFEFYHDGKQMFHYKKMTHKQRMASVLGEEVMEYMIPISGEYDYLRFEGYISKPQLSSQTTRKEFFFVNERFIYEPLFSQAVKKTYGTLLEPGRHPHIVLFMNIPHQLIDVNVHPRKETIHFIDTGMALESLKEVVKEALEKAELYFVDRRWDRRGDFEKEWRIREGGTQTKGGKRLKKQLIEKDSLLKEASKKTLTQYHNVYIVSESERGFLFIDQHAAHERILYEKLVSSYDEEAKKNESISLDEPVTLNISPHEYAILKEFRPQMENYSLIYELTPKTMVVTTIPVLWEDRDVIEMMRAFLDELIENDGVMYMDIFTKKMITYIACRSAVKAGDPLTEDQMRRILEELNETSS
jgi:DNA mismatch repair protein MutL